MKYVSCISNNLFCIYFINKHTVDFLIEKYLNIQINDQYMKLRWLINPDKKVIFSKVSPAIPNNNIIFCLQELGIKFVSISKAYDNAWKPLTISNLKETLSPNKMLNFMCNFLSIRTFKVRVCHEFFKQFTQFNGAQRSTIFCYAISCSFK